MILQSKIPIQSAVKLFVVASASLMFVTGCGKKADPAQEEQIARAQTANDVAKAVSNAVNNATNGENKTEHKSAAHAISSETLANLLPSISGYTAGEPEKASTSFDGTEWSSASREYTNGDKSIKVTYFDYNYITGLSAGYSMLMNFSQENGEELQRGEKFGSNPGWINWKKKDNRGEIGVVVGDRVFVVIEARGGATMDELRSIGNSINYSGIAKAST